MPDEEFLKNFHFKVESTKAIFDLFSKTISIQATLASLKDIIFNNLKELTYKSEEELLEEYETIFQIHKHELLTDFISKYGQVNSSN